MVDTIYVNNPGSFIPVEYWRGGAPAKPWCNSRAGYYGSNYTPHLIYDGILDAEYFSSQYVAKFNLREPVPTDVTLDLTGGPTYSPVNWEFTVNVCIEAGGTGRDLRIYVIEVNDDYPPYPTYSRNTFRQAAATEDVTLAAGECTEVVRKLDFDAIALLYPEGISIVAWAQEPVSPPPGAVAAEIYQAAIFDVAGLPGLFAGFETGDLSEWSTAYP